ncbi:hypothetical protein YY92_00845 [Campylobacter fetus]|uniref:hypothetical protein n=1 Tax=Campylobacter fetus TaxID=196 RepID=UPI0011CC7DC7|nr:hypothetical protein [Campylobacter fetus]EAJ1231314.1 hypothetical protein [Campylobacter fetus]EAK0413273.1 hypothetical protein [Campylobacter fetus]TXF08272.1 hypothetical protein FPD25_06450 [Campylobacter fetus subsp. fetus]
MQVTDSIITKYVGSAYKSINNDDDNSFGDTLTILVSQSSSNDNPSNSNKIDTVEKFLENLSKYGSAVTLININQQKIDEKLEQKRQELMASLDVENLSDEDKAKAIASINETLEDYKKQLEKEMNEKRMAEQTDKDKLKSILSNL